MIKKLAILLVVVVSTGNAAMAFGKEEAWMVGYNPNLDLEDYDQYQTLVFDDRHPLLEPLLDRDKLVVGYLSLGMINPSRPYYDSVKKEGLLLEEKRKDNNALIDIRNPLWTRRVLEEIIPIIITKGFKGIAIDSLDKLIALEESNPSRYSGMREAAIRLIRTIKMHYPSITIILKSHSSLIEDAGPYIYGVIVDSMYTSKEHDSDHYIINDAANYRNEVNYLQKIKQAHPKLKLMTMDYWYKADHKMIEKIYHEQREQGFIPYVMTIESQPTKVLP